MSGNNYQIIGHWKDDSGCSYFGYAETKAEAENLIEGWKDLKRFPKHAKIVRWEIRKCK